MTISAKELANKRIERLRLPRVWQNFIGSNLPNNVHFRVLFSGPTGSGKSTFLLKLFDNISKKDWRTLYGNFEERTSVGTINTKLKDSKIRNDNIHFLESRSIDEFIEALETGNYKFAIIDSLSVLFDRKKEIQDFFYLLETKFPNIPFFIVVHYMKDSQNYYGSTYLQHDVDIFWETRNGEVYQRKNRFINGSKMPTMKIWK